MKKSVLACGIGILLSSFAMAADKGNMDIGSSTGPSALAKSRLSYYLYAECKVKSCELKSDSGSTPDDYVCNVGLNLSKANIQVFKYSGEDLNKQHDGLFGYSTGGAAGSRLGNQFLESITIQDGEKSLQVSADMAGDLRNFTIDYSSKTEPVTTGHAEISLSGAFYRYAKLELYNCQTN